MYANQGTISDPSIRSLARADNAGGGCYASGDQSPVLRATDLLRANQDELEKNLNYLAHRLDCVLEPVPEAPRGSLPEPCAGYGLHGMLADAANREYRLAQLVAAIANRLTV